MATTPTTRAKDPKIVAESQKIFGVVRVIGWSLAGVVLLVIVLVGVSAAKKAAIERAAQSRATQVVAAPAVAPELPRCAEGDYDFSKAKVPEKFVVDYRTDCVTEVTLPLCVTFRTHPSSDVKITFIDGAVFVDGPGKRVWFGHRREIFKVQGLKEAGTMEISLQESPKIAP